MADFYVWKDAPGPGPAPYDSWSDAAAELATVFTYLVANPQAATIYVRRGTYVTAYSGQLPGQTIVVRPEFLKWPWPVLPSITCTGSSEGTATSLTMHGFTIAQLSHVEDNVGVTLLYNLVFPSLSSANPVLAFIGGGVATIRNCLVKGNTGAGMGISMVGGADNFFLKNNVVANVQNNRGIYATTGGNVTVQNNTADGCDTGIYVGAIGGSTTVSHNCYNNNNTDITGASKGTGALTTDPKFVDPANGDFRLKRTSPCIDAGTGAVADEPAPNGSAINIGAYGGTEWAQKTGITNKAWGYSLRTRMWREIVSDIYLTIMTKDENADLLVYDETYNRIYGSDVQENTIMQIRTKAFQISHDRKEPVRYVWVTYKSETSLQFNLYVENGATAVASDVLPITLPSASDVTTVKLAIRYRANTFSVEITEAAVSTHEVEINKIIIDHGGKE